MRISYHFGILLRHSPSCFGDRAALTDGWPFVGEPPPVHGTRDAAEPVEHVRPVPYKIPETVHLVLENLLGLTGRTDRAATADPVDTRQRTATR